MKKVLVVFFAFFCLVLGYYTYLYYTKQPLPFVSKRTTGAYYSAGVISTNEPLDFPLDSIQLLDREASGLKEKILIADPFLLKHNESIYFFFELMGATGADIAVARLEENNKLKFLGVVLDEAGHLSYPYVFENNGELYMIPESKSLNEVRLYKAIDFPLKWELDQVLIQNKALSDPTLYVAHDHYYMFCEQNRELHIYYTDSIKGKWKPHAKNPVKKGNYTRQAGRIFTNNGRSIRFAQDHYGGYGRAVYGFVIDSISPAEYKETPLQNNPIVRAQGETWAKNGMHHIDILPQENGTYLIALDGKGYGNESIHFDLDN